MPSSLRTSRWCSLLLFTLLLASCAGDPVQPTEQIIIPSANETVIYSKHIAPIFRASCAGSGCHVTPHRGGGLVLDSWQSLMRGSDFGATVVPYSPFWSHLLQHISTDTTIAPIALPRMPLSRDPLPREQILAIKQWIEQGAKNDAGEVALSGDRPRAWVTCQGADRLTVIDLETLLTARHLPVGVEPDGVTAPEAPHNVVLSPDRRYVYVNLIATGVVEKYDAITFERLGRVQVGSSPAQVAVSSDGATLFVSNFTTLSSQPEPIHRVDAATMSVTAVIERAGYAPHGVALSPDGRFVYTTNAYGDDLSIIDVATNEVVGRIPVAADVPPVPVGPAKYEPYQGTFGTDPNLFWFTCRASAEVRVVDVATEELVDVIAVGSRPLILQMTPDGRELWVPNQGSDNVSIIDVATRTVKATIQGLATQPHAVAFTDDGRFAFVTCENQKSGAVLHHPITGSKSPGIVYVIDTWSHAVIRQFEVPAFAAGVAVGG